MKSTGYVLLQDESNDLNGALQELRTKEELLDVTLACEDETIEAHKVVLSASSLFFQSIFKKTKQPHPFIYLRGVFYKDLVALLDYIYTGKAQIASDDVNRFMQVGRDLKVKSLSSEENDDSVSNENITEAIHQIEAVIDGLSPKVHLDKHLTNAAPEIENEKDELKKTCEIESFSCEVSAEDDDFDQNKGDVKGNKKQEDGIKNKEQLWAEISKRIKKISNDKGTGWKCNVCGKIYKKKDKLKNHVEIHLDCFNYVCIHCKKEHKTRSALSGHMYYQHKGLK